MLFRSILLMHTLLLGCASVSAAPDFPLKVSDNHRHFMDQQGKRYFVMGDTPWFPQKPPTEDVCRVMDDRQAKGFTTLFLEFLDHTHMPSRDVHGNVSFEPEKDTTNPSRLTGAMRTK